MPFGVIKVSFCSIFGSGLTSTSLSPVLGSSSYIFVLISSDFTSGTGTDLDFKISLTSELSGPSSSFYTGADFAICYRFYILASLVENLTLYCY